MCRGLAGALAVLLASVLSSPAARASDIQTGWAAWFNSKQLADKWTVASDLQLRSTDDWQAIRFKIARVALNRSWRDGISFGLGYAHVVTVEPDAPDLTERRLFQQFLLQRRVGSNPITHRLRLEQRAIERSDGSTVHADRLRYYARLLVPLNKADDGSFSTGNYLAFQNEVFLNLSARDRLNGKLLDQNRAYLGLGRRLGSAFDLEAGYLLQHVQGRSSDTLNHAIQVSLHTRF